MTAFRPRILVVDDEPQIHRFLGPALDAAGYEHVRAEDGLSALKEIARKPPDAVVLDLGLPDIDGKEALTKARAFYGGPIIILSARDKETEKIDALDAGADDYVEKPFGVGELLTGVWGPAHAHDVQYLRVFIGQLRQKLEQDANTPRLIVTEPGVGYRFLAD